MKRQDRNLFGGGGRGAEEEEARRLAHLDKELQQEVDELEKDINELRATYELFFLGVEKLEPQTQRDLVKSRLRRFQERKPRNTALRFRFQQLKARMVSLENYWQRTLRQREAGTYHRDLARMKRRETERLRREAEARRGENARASDAPPAAASGSSGQAIDPAAPVSSAAGSGRRPGSGATAPQRPSARSAEDLTEPKLRKLYDTYLGARRRCGESTDLRFEDMAATLRKQVPRLMAKTGATSVEFKVVIRGGKAVLKALPKA